MKESEERSSNIDEQKARIRQRYKGIDPEELEVIPALPPEDIFKTEKKLRVAVYARVSTDDPVSLSESQQEVLNIWNNLDEKEQNVVIQMLRGLQK